MATFSGLNAPKRKTVLARGRVLPLPDGRLLAVALDIADQERLLVRLGATMGGAFLLALLLGGLSADWLARRFVRSLGSISAAAGRIRAFPHRGKHVSIVWKTPGNMFPLRGTFCGTTRNVVSPTGRARLRPRRRKKSGKRGGIRRWGEASPPSRFSHSPALSARRDGSPHQEIPQETV